jgi:hypothetical protein
MRKGYAGVLLFALTWLDTSAAFAQQGEIPADCDSNLASAPGQTKEYDLFKHVGAAVRGCATSPVTYQKIDAPQSNGRGRASPQSASPQQEELDRAACRSEAETNAKTARGLAPGEYDIFKSTIATQSGDIEKAEQSCMAQRGYKSVAK